MSSRSISSTGSSISISTTPPTPPSKLTHHLHDLTLLARITLTPSYNATHIFRYILNYQRQRDRIAAHFSQYQGADFDGVFLCVLEMKILVRLIERGLGMETEKIDWPACGLGENETERLRKLAYERVDGWVFGKEVVEFGDKEEKEHERADERVEKM